jgi:hypothetical protein
MMENMGNANSGRRDSITERRARKLEVKVKRVEAKAVDHALEVYKTGTSSQKLDLTKALIPKTVQRVTDPASGQRPGILIMIMPKDQITAQEQAPRAPVIEITAQDVEVPSKEDNASNDQPEANP